MADNDKLTEPWTLTDAQCEAPRWFWSDDSPGTTVREVRERFAAAGMLTADDAKAAQEQVFALARMLGRQ